jgi:hypothetical protein
MDLIVCSFYTNGFYSRLAHRLGASCRANGLDCYIIPLDDRGRWVLNCAAKATFVLECLERHGRPVLWIDADAVMRNIPALLDETEAEFAIRAEPGGRTKTPCGRQKISLPPQWPPGLSPRWFNSGTVYIRPTEKGMELAAEWAVLSEEKPTDWDQWTLQEAWTHVLPRTEWLPKPYCQIRGRADTAVIQHEIASIRQAKGQRR